MDEMAEAASGGEKDFARGFGWEEKRVEWFRAKAASAAKGEIGGAARPNPCLLRVL